MRPLLLLTLLVAACAPQAPTIQAQNGVSDRCARQVDDDPVYKADLAKSAGTLEYGWQYGPKIEADRNAAIDRCQNGLRGHRGGVERPGQTSRIPISSISGGEGSGGGGGNGMGR